MFLISCILLTLRRIRNLAAKLQRKSEKSSSTRYFFAGGSDFSLYINQVKDLERNLIANGQLDDTVVSLATPERTMTILKEVQETKVVTCIYNEVAELV